MFDRHVILSVIAATNIQRVCVGIQSICQRRVLTDDAVIEMITNTRFQPMISRLLWNGPLRTRR
jgi:hypothetical protein